MRWAVISLLVGLVLTGCVSRPAPEPAQLRSIPTPWSAPRDAISYIKAAGLPELPLNTTDDPYIFDLVITVDGQRLELPPYIGVDRLRAIQAPVHTHESDGTVWLEGPGNRAVSLGQFFDLWGVKFDDRCLAIYCTGLRVTADGKPVSDARKLVLRGNKLIEISAHSR